MKRFSTLDISLAILAVMMLLCLLPMPYGYYTLVRFIAMVVFVCMAVVEYRKERMTMAVVAGALAVLFQPLMKITLDRDTWNVVDVVVAVGIGWYLVKSKKKTEG